MQEIYTWWMYDSLPSLFFQLHVAVTLLQFEPWTDPHPTQSWAVSRKEVLKHITLHTLIIKITDIRMLFEQNVLLLAKWICLLWKNNSLIITRCTRRDWNAQTPYWLSYIICAWLRHRSLKARCFSLYWLGKCMW